MDQEQISQFLCFSAMRNQDSIISWGDGTHRNHPARKNTGCDLGVASSELTLVLNETGVHSPLSSVDSGLVCVWFDSGPHFPVRSSRAFHADDRGYNVELERGRRTVAAIWARDYEWKVAAPVGEPISIVVGKNGLGWGIGVLATDDSNFRVSSDPVKSQQIQMVEMIVAD